MNKTYFPLEFSQLPAYVILYSGPWHFSKGILY